MNKAVRKIILNAQLAGVKIGLPGERRGRSSTQAGPVAAAQPLFSGRPASRDYTLPEPEPVMSDPYANYMTVVPDSVGRVDLRRQYQFNTELAQRDFKVMGLSEAQLKAGFTYLLIQKIGTLGVSQPLVTRIHPHKGGGGPHDLEFMRALAARESQKVRNRDANTAIYRQTLIVVPPEDKVSGKIRWLTHEDGYNTALDKYLDPDGMAERMGASRADLLKKFSTSWSDLTPLVRKAAPAAQIGEVDYMQAVRASSGNLSRGPST